jgi:hypothetical protein
MLLDQYHLVSKMEPSRGLTSGELFSAVDHLVKAAGILEECRTAIHEGLFDEPLIQKIEESWNEVNLCRVHTEKIPFIEELLIPVMGEINDAKSMMESLVAWKLGMTRQAYFSIMGCLSDALEDLRSCIGELSSWDRGVAGEERDAEQSGESE